MPGQVLQPQAPGLCGGFSLQTIPLLGQPQWLHVSACPQVLTGSSGLTSRLPPSVDQLQAVPGSRFQPCPSTRPIRVILVMRPTHVDPNLLEAPVDTDSRPTHYWDSPCRPSFQSHLRTRSAPLASRTRHVPMDIAFWIAQCQAGFCGRVQANPRVQACHSRTSCQIQSSGLSQQDLLLDWQSPHTLHQLPGLPICRPRHQTSLPKDFRSKPTQGPGQVACSESVDRLTSEGLSQKKLVCKSLLVQMCKHQIKAIKKHEKRKRHNSTKRTQQSPSNRLQRNRDLLTAGQRIHNNGFKEGQQTPRKYKETIQ